MKEIKKQTFLKKYGVDNPSKDMSVKEKTAKTNIGKYGYANPLMNPDIRKKSEVTCLSRYGETSYSKTAEYSRKVKMSNMEKFGVEYPNQDPDIRKAAQKRYSYDGISFDSKPELALYIWARDNEVDFEYQPEKRIEYEYDGVVHVYQPDFVIAGELYELKGPHFFENGKMINPFDRSMDGVYEAKHQCMIRNGVKILTDAQYVEYIDYVAEKYGAGYLDGFKTNVSGSRNGTDIDAAAAEMFDKMGYNEFLRYRKTGFPYPEYDRK